MRVFWRNRSIAYGLVLAIATVMLTSDYAGASVRYRLGAGDTIDLTAVTKTNQGAGSGWDADTVDGKHASDFMTSGASGVKDTDIDWGLSAGQVNTDDVPEGTANKYFSGKTSDNLPEGSTNLYNTADEKAALAGTSGAPSVSNKYVTNDDSRNTDSRAPSGTASGDLSGSYPNPTIGADKVNDLHLDWGSGANQIDTDDIPEGSGNLFYLDSRVDGRLDTAQTIGANWLWDKTGIASSTATQADSYDVTLRGSFWTGAAEATHDFTWRNIASTTANEEARLALLWDSTELLSANKDGDVVFGNPTRLGLTGITAKTFTLDGVVAADDYTTNFEQVFDGQGGGEANMSFYNTGVSASNMTARINVDAGNVKNGILIFKMSDSSGTENDVLSLVGSNQCMGLGTSTFGTSADKVFGLALGVIPITSPTDIVQLFCGDISSGNAGLFLRSETGDIHAIGSTAIFGYQSPVFQEVAGTAWNPMINAHDSGNGGIAITQWSTVDANASHVWLSKSGSSTIGTHALVINGEILGDILFNGSDGTTFVNAAAIRGEVDGTAALNDMPGRLVFLTTADGADTLTERGWIDSSGNLLWGTGTAPASLAGGFVVKNGTGNSADVEDQWTLYGADESAGNSCPHFRTENGSIIKLYKEAALTSGDATAIDATYDSVEQGVLNNVRTRLDEIEDALQAQGFLS